MNRCFIFRNTFSLEFYNSEIQNFVYWRQNFQICRNSFSCSVLSFFFFSFTLCNKLCCLDCASFLDGFCDTLAGVLFFYYSVHKSQYQIKYNLKITSLRVKIENKNLNAILDSKKFQNTEIWKAWARNGLVKWHFTWIAVLPQAKGPGNLIKLQSYNRLRTVDFWLTLFYIGLILGGFS